MLNYQRGLTLPRPTAAPTATQLGVCLTPRSLWRQAVVWETNVRHSLRQKVLTLLDVCLEHHGVSIMGPVILARLRCAWLGDCDGPRGPDSPRFGRMRRIRILYPDIAPRHVYGITRGVVGVFGRATNYEPALSSAGVTLATSWSKCTSGLTCATATVTLSSAVATGGKNTRWLRMWARSRPSC